MTPPPSKTAEVDSSRPTAASPTRPPPDWAAASDRGRERGNNEDSWGAFALGGQLRPLATAAREWPVHGELYVLSDGMGGARAGEVASRFCVERLATELHTHRDGSDAAAAMREAFVATHIALCELSRLNPDWHGMGATLSALWLQPGGGAVLGHVGDSRIYACHDGQWRQLTEDHTLGDGLVRRGGMTAEAASRFRFRFLLEKVMGGDGRSIEPQIVTAGWQEGDAFALCSDGLHRPLAVGLEHRLADAAQGSQLAAGVASLVEAANAAGGPDNITVLLARLSFFNRS